MPKISTYSEVQPQPGDIIIIVRAGKNYVIDYSELRRKNIDRVTVAPAAQPVIDTDDGDIFQIEGLNTAITSLSANLSGTPQDGELIMLQITDDGTARAISHGATFESTTNAVLLTTTTAGKMARELLQWNEAAAAWQCLGVTVEA